MVQDVIIYSHGIQDKKERNTTMKKMYKVEANYYTNAMESRGSEWKQVEGYKNTMEEAEAVAQTIKRVRCVQNSPA